MNECRADSGLYVIWFFIHQPLTIAVGALGELTFPQGEYAYIGSAQRGRSARIRRHLKMAKRKHWHMDYIRPHAVVTGVTCHDGRRKDECALVTTLLQEKDGRRMPRNFGSSDCRCGGHLLYFAGHRPEK